MWAGPCRLRPLPLAAGALPPHIYGFPAQSAGSQISVFISHLAQLYSPADHGKPPPKPAHNRESCQKKQAGSVICFAGETERGFPTTPRGVVEPRSVAQRALCVQGYGACAVP